MSDPQEAINRLTGRVSDLENTVANCDLHARRATDRYRDGDGLALERRYALLNAAAIIDARLARDVLMREPDRESNHIVTGTVYQEVTDVVNRAEHLLTEIERREREKQQKGHEAWLERSELNEGKHE